MINFIILSVATLLSSWQFAFEQDSMQMPASSWVEVSVPHDWAIYGDFSRENDLQEVAITQNGSDVPSVRTGRTGGLPYPGIGWYKTIVSIDKLDGMHYSLLFDGAMSEAIVFVNGEEVGNWPYGYNAFHFDITKYLLVGDNEISVRLDNKPESSRWYPGAGLYRNVHLISTKDTYIPIWGTKVYTKDVNENRAVLDITTNIQTSTTSKLILKTEVLTQNYTVASTSHVINPKKGTSVHQTININWPHLWSPESPTLYTIRYTLYKDKEIVDTYEEKTGIRTIAIVPDKGFYLNGKLRKFQGVCLHHDLGPLGAAVHRDAILNQLLLLRDMGCDAIRTSHNMPAPELVELSDSLGFMLMVEPFDEWEWGKCKNGYHRFFEVTAEGSTQTWAERDMVNMIHHFRNHPSVVMWSIGNEVPTQCEPEGYKYAKFLQDICTREDGTRPTTCGMDGVDCVLANGFANVMQVIGINYRAHRYEEIYNATPQKLVLGSETASTVSSRGEYKVPALKNNNNMVSNVPHPNGDGKQNQCSSYDLEYCPWSNIPDDDFANMEDYPWTIGQFVWTGFDYLGEPTPFDTDAWPSHSSYFGIIDLASIPKDRYYLYRSQWNKRSHTLHILPHWNWQEGDTLPVMVYTDYPEAELFINGVSKGRQHKYSKEEAASDGKWGRIRRYRLIWDDIAWEPGEISVIAYDANGKPSMNAIMRTAKEPFYVELNPRNVGELTYVNVQILDINNTLCPKADNKVHIEFSGEGEYIASANGDATCLIPFNSQDQQAFNGQLTIIVKGKGTLKVTSKGIEGAIIEL